MATLLSLLLLGLVPAAQAARITQPTSAITSDMRPIRKVITLIEEMKAQAEKDADADEKAYEKYMCWCTTNREEKNQAVEIATTRISELETLIEEATATAGTLRTELATLAKEIEADEAAKAEATSVREKEKDAYEAESADMKETIELLKDAYNILSKVQLLQKNGQNRDAENQQATVALVQLRNIVKARFADRFRDNMQRDLFEVLGSLPDPVKGASFPQLLPWEKTEEQIGMESKANDLSGAATGAKSYNSRSGSILGILGAMGDDFVSDLKAATKKEEDAEATFQKLIEAKNGEIAAATEESKRKEATLAKTLAERAKDRREKESLEKALSADQRFLATLEKNCEDEDTGYKKRVEIRSEEIRALAETLKILTEDSARELYAKTVSFVQSSSESAAQSRAVRRAVERIAAVARKGKNWQLASLAARMQLDAFTKVKKAMDTMMAELKKQQKEEYAKWETCKKNIDKTEDDIKEATELKEDLGEKHQALVDEIKTLTDEIAALKKDIAENEISLKQAGEERKAANELFQTQVSDQRATTNILKKAADRLRQFYGFSQVSATSGQDPVPGADAPPPPPSGKDYSKSGLSGGVLQMLDKIISDGEVEEGQLAQAEQKGQSDYAEYVASAKNSIEADREAVRQREQRVAEAGAEKSETEAAQLSNNEDLTKLQDLLKAHHIECDFLLKYFDIRQEARKEEMDAINDAKAILSGANFQP